MRACAAPATPLLGVCLGHQAIGVAFGGTVDRAPELLHGKTSTVLHTGSGCAAGLPDPFTATRYHSLTDAARHRARPNSRSPARTESGVIMARAAHATLPIHGVQFHPESVLTEGGHRMLANWLASAAPAPTRPCVARLEGEMGALTA